VDGLGRPHVLYYDETRGDLMYTHADAVAAGLWEGGIVRPGTLTLLSVGPNPASTRTSVRFRIRPDDPSRVQPISLRLFDLGGREVSTLEYLLPAGVHQVSIPLGGRGMPPLAAGAYYLQVRADDSSAQEGAPLIIVP
jgi:hypothetical protein